MIYNGLGKSLNRKFENTNLLALYTKNKNIVFDEIEYDIGNYENNNLSILTNVSNNNFYIGYYKNINLIKKKLKINKLETI